MVEKTEDLGFYSVEDILPTMQRSPIVCLSFCIRTGVMYFFLLSLIFIHSSLSSHGVVSGNESSGTEAKYCGCRRKSQKLVIAIDGKVIVLWVHQHSFFYCIQSS